MVVTIRSAVAADPAAIAQISIEAFAANPVEAGWSSSDVMARAAGIFAEMSVRCIPHAIIAEVDGLTAGWCGVVVARGEVADLWVSPRFQRRGVATALVTEACRRIRMAGGSAAVLETHRDNSTALAFYRRMAFDIWWQASADWDVVGAVVEKVGLRKFL